MTLIQGTLCNWAANHGPSSTPVSKYTHIHTGSCAQ